MRRLETLLDSERVIHSVKTALACLIGFMVTKSIHFDFDQWLIITILVVMCAQINVGSVIQKSYMRFLGTLVGSLTAALVIELFGADPLAIAVTISLAALLFSYIATGQTSYSDAGTLGAVTVTIILVGQHPTLMTASSRFIEINIGILIAAIISQFIFPIHARRHLRDLQATTLRQLRAYYLATFLTDQTENESYEELDENIAKSLATQRKLANDAKREPLGTFNINHFKQSLNSEKEILRSISYMHHAYKASPNSKKLFSTMDFLHCFHDKISEALEELAARIEKTKTERKTIELPTIESVKKTIDTARANFKSNDIIYADAFLFCAEVLITQLEKLISLTAEIA